MRRIVLARHAETDWNLRDALNGDPAVDVRLTERGRDQARALGRAVEDVDVVAHTAFARTRETAELAWPGAPRVVVAELNEIAYGSFEGTAWRDGYHEWVTAAGPRDECPGGGESRAAAIGRYVSGYRAVLAREEDTVAVVAHGMHVAYVLLGLWLARWAAGELAAYAGRHWREHGPPPIESERAPGWMPGPLD